jgi:hypothetical protein
VLQSRTDGSFARARELLLDEPNASPAGCCSAIEPSRRRQKVLTSTKSKPCSAGVMRSQKGQLIQG